jgi:hypothetical protein
MSLLPTRAESLLAGTMGLAVWSISGPTGVWQRSARGMPSTDDHVSGLAAVSGSPPRIFAATLGSGVFSTADGGRHWRSVSKGLTNSKDAMIVLSLAYSPTAHTLYAGTSVGVYRLSTATATRATPE